MYLGAFILRSHKPIKEIWINAHNDRGKGIKINTNKRNISRNIDKYKYKYKTRKVQP